MVLDDHGITEGSEDQNSHHKLGDFITSQYGQVKDVTKTNIRHGEQDHQDSHPLTNMVEETAYRVDGFFEKMPKPVQPFTHG
jgi:hypothetical protein